METCGRPRVLITGADGLLGRNALKALKSDFDIYAIVHKSPVDPLQDVNYLILDLSEHWSISNLPNSIDIVIHLAQSSHFRNFPEKALDIFQVNVASTARLLDFAYRNRVKKFIFASSGGVYGSGRIAFDENAPIMPPEKLGYYLGSKLYGEILVNNYAKFMSVVVLRFFFMYGPGQKRSMLIPRLVDSIKAGVPITMEGKYGIKINPIHVSDATQALVRSLDFTESATINIGGPEVISLRKICDIIGNLLGTRPKYICKDSTPSDLIGDITAMREYLCAPRIRIAEGVKDLL
ncbi:MAG TPA: NAD(P)-dependent oxidoreductase [Syntrophales bacterium]|nr:NAD(P)-dependent oxidoreductase [Syntrophales bacterium]HOO00748.1 NAD(P)-dependent oxidoreductase [Syntrophales bacterium]